MHILDSFEMVSAEGSAALAPHRPRRFPLQGRNLVGAAPEGWGTPTSQASQASATPGVCNARREVAEDGLCRSSGMQSSAEAPEPLLNDLGS